MCPFADFNRPKLDICINLQKNQCIGEQIFFGGMELLNNTHHILLIDFAGLAKDFEIIYPKCDHLLNLTDQNWTFAPIYMKKHCIGEQIIISGSGAPK